MWSLLALLAILWNYGNCQGTTTSSPSETTKTPTRATTTTLPTTIKLLTTSTTTTKQPPTATPACGLAKVDLVIVLDASTSVTASNYIKMLSFCKDFLKNAEIDSGSVRVGVVIYSTDVQVQFHLNRHSTKAAVLQAIDRIPYIYGSTNTADGLKTMRTQMFSQDNGDRPDVENIALVMTDGISNINARRTIPEAQQASAEGIHIYAIGIGLSDTTELDAIATPPAEENSFALQDFNELEGLVVDIFSSTCPVIPSTPAPETTSAPETTTTTILMSSTKPECELSKVDLVFVLNASTSLTEAKFVKMLNFVKSFLAGAAVDNGNVRVGALIVGTEVSIQFHLNEYSDTASLFKSIENIPYIYDNTTTEDGLEAMYHQMFTEDKGDRPYVPNVAVVITDGISNINASRTILEAEDARAAGIYLYEVGIELDGDKELIGTIFKPAGHNTFSVQNIDKLAGLEKRIFSSICPVTPAPETTTTTIRLSTATPGCVYRKDIIFVLDSSSSVGEKNFELALEFVSSMVEELSQRGSDNRYALITFSDYVHYGSQGLYSSASIVLNAIKNTPYIPGSTNTAVGLRTALEISSPEYGDRQDVDNIVMLVAGGQSNVNTQDTIPAADELKKTGAKIMTIGVGLSDYKELESISSGSEYVYKVNTYNLLGDVKADILETSCSGNE